MFNKKELDYVKLFSDVYRCEDDLSYLDRALKEKHPDDIIYEGVSLLSSACLCNNFKAAEKMLLKGANPNGDRFRPMLLCAKENAYLSMNALIDFGGDLNVTGYANNTPLHFCAGFYEESRIKDLRLVRRISGQKNMNMDLEKIYHFQMTEFLIKNGADVNAQNKSGQTPLHIAITNNDMGMIQYLLSSKDINVNIPDDNGNTAIYYALSKENASESVLKGLLSAGADLTWQNVYGKTPFDYEKNQDSPDKLHLIQKHVRLYPEEYVKSRQYT